MALMLRRCALSPAARRMCSAASSSAPPPPPLVHCATIESVPGHTIVEYLGLVEGSTVRTKNVAHDAFAAVRQVLGGELTSYTELLREARTEATERMSLQATERGANAVVGVRVVSSSVAAGASEILIYGTAVKVSKD